MYLIFDIGATKIRLAVSHDGETFGEPKVGKTPHNYEEGMQLFAELASHLRGGEPIKLSAGGIRGVFDEKKEKIINDPYLEDWLNKPIKERLREILECEVHLANDSDLVGLGEAVVGAGKGYRIVAYITVSTGIGGVRIVNGKIDVSTCGFEPGHQIIDADGSIFSEIVKKEKDWTAGEWESLASGTAMRLRFNKEPYEIKDEQIWEEVSKYVAVGLNNTIVHWSPDVVVLGGGMMKSPGILLDTVRSHLKEILKIFPKHPEIKKAELGDFGGLHGALVYIKQLQGE